MKPVAPSAAAASAPPPRRPAAELLEPERQSPAELSRSAAEKLHDQLDSGLALLGKCEDLVQQGKGDRTKPIQVAAQIMRANSDTARTIPYAAYGETRHRSISEKVRSSAAANPVGERIDAITDIVSRWTLALAKEMEEEANEDRASYEKTKANQAKYGAQGATATAPK